MKNLFLKSVEIITGSLSLLLVVINTLLLFIPFLIIAVTKIIPIKKWQLLCTSILGDICNLWVSGNNGLAKIFTRSHLDVEGCLNLNTKSWYLVVSNHQSWLDIVILQRLLNRKIPTLKFFVKSELILPMNKFFLSNKISIEFLFI